MTDKRTLKRQYLDTTTRAGVYAIRNLATGRALVDGSTNAQGALNRHRFELRHGRHRNALLRQDWISHGETSFVFEVLDLLKPRNDASFDPVREMETLLSLWRQEIPCQGERGYDRQESGA